jgi:hypothetical protein
VLGESLSGLDLSGTTHTDAGTFDGDAWTFIDVTGNYNGASGTVAIVIDKADASVLVNGYSGTYDAAAHGASLGHATGVNGEDLSGLLDLGAAFTNAPGGLAHWSFAGGTNYNGASGTVAIVIDKAHLTVAAHNASKTYDGSAYSGGDGVSYSGFVNGETTSELGGTLAYSGSSQGAINAGSYTITPGGLSSDNYEISYFDGTLTIDKAALSGSAVTVDILQSTLNLEQRNGTITFSIRVDKDANHFNAASLEQVELLGVIYTPGTTASWVVDASTNTLVVTLRMDQIRGDLIAAATTGQELTEWVAQGSSKVNNLAVDVTGIADDFTVIGSDAVNLLVTKKFLNLLGINV